VEKHTAYIKSFTKIWQENDKIEFVATEHFWLSGIYWGLTALHLLGKLDEVDKEAVVAWTLSCKHQDGSGGYGSSPRNDAHLLYTLSAVQVLALFDKLDLVDADGIAAYVAR
jgi:geranylgeranyl transferase type-2 subunit beta